MKRIIAVFCLFLILSCSLSLAEETIGQRVKDTPKPTLRQLNINVAKDYNTYPTAQVLEEATRKSYGLINTNLVPSKSLLFIKRR